MTTHHRPRPVHGIPTPRTPQAMQELRVCRDCGRSYRYSDTHHNSRYCTGCLPGHVRCCQVCKTPFPVRADTDRLCPIHVIHAPLF